MVKITQMTLVLTALLTIGSTASAQEHVGLPGYMNPGQPMLRGGGQQVGCQIAGALRLTLNSMKCNCHASQSSKGGNLPDDPVCNSPTNTLANSGDTGAAYKLGARPSLGPIVDPAPRGSVDCSGFISAGLCRAGMPFKPGNDVSKCEDMTTRAMIEAIDRNQSCFMAIPAGAAKPVLKGGEIVVYPHAGKDIGHVFAVDRVGSDCHNVSIIQSESSKSGIGITTINGLSAKSDEQGMAHDDLLKLNCGEGLSATNKVKIVRFNPDKAGCTPQPNKHKLKNEGCVSSCKVGTMMDHDG